MKTIILALAATLSACGPLTVNVDIHDNEAAVDFADDDQVPEPERAPGKPMDPTYFDLIEVRFPADSDAETVKNRIEDDSGLELTEWSAAPAGEWISVTFAPTAIGRGPTEQSYIINEVRARGYVEARAPLLEAQ